jgi:hypothetical protein
MSSRIACSGAAAGGRNRSVRETDDLGTRGNLKVEQQMRDDGRRRRTNRRLVQMFRDPATSVYQTTTLP